jgi:hypothetical protein
MSANVEQDGEFNFVNGEQIHHLGGVYNRSTGFDHNNGEGNFGGGGYGNVGSVQNYGHQGYHGANNGANGRPAGNA